jgi:hypothetical protein
MNVRGPGGRVAPCGVSARLSGIDPAPDGRLQMVSVYFRDRFRSRTRSMSSMAVAERGESALT